MEPVFRWGLHGSNSAAVRAVLVFLFWMVLWFSVLVATLGRPVQVPERDGTVQAWSGAPHPESGG